MKRNLEKVVFYQSSYSSKETTTWLQVERNMPNRNIVALAGLTGILSCLDDIVGIESDWDKHLSVTNDLFGQYIYWRPHDMYIELISEYEQRIRPRIKEMVPVAVNKIDFILKNMTYAIDFIAGKPVFPNTFSTELRKVFISNYYYFYGRFKRFFTKKFPELIIQQRIT